MQAWLPNEQLLSIRHDAGSRPLVHPPARRQGNPALLRPMPRRLNLETAVIPTGSEHLWHRRYRYAPLFLPADRYQNLATTYIFDWLGSHFGVVEELGQTSSSSSAHARCTPNGRSSHAPSQHHRGLDVPCRKNCSNAVPSDISERLGIPDAPSQRTPFYRIHLSLNPASILLPGLLKPMLNRRQHRCHHLPGARRTQLYRGLDP